MTCAKTAIVHNQPSCWANSMIDQTGMPCLTLVFSHGAMGHPAKTNTILQGNQGGKTTVGAIWKGVAVRRPDTRRRDTSEQQHGYRTRHASANGARIRASQELVLWW